MPFREVHRCGESNDNVRFFERMTHGWKTTVGMPFREVCRREESSGNRLRFPHCFYSMTDCKLQKLWTMNAIGNSLSSFSVVLHIYKLHSTYCRIHCMTHCVIFIKFVVKIILKSAPDFRLTTSVISRQLIGHSDRSVTCRVTPWVEEVHKAFGLIGPVWRGSRVGGKSGGKDSKGSIE